MEVTLKRADVNELEEQTIARFLNGLSPSINKIVDFQPYKNLVKLLHQATKAERHVQADQRTRAYYASKHEADKSAPSVPTQVRNSSMATKNSSSTKTLPNMETPASSSKVTCFKCGGKGHMSYECINTKVMLTDENGDTISLSEDEYEALANGTISQSVQNQQQDTLLCDHDKNPALIVTRVLTINSSIDEDQRTNLFHTRAAIHGKSIRVIIDGGSCHNFASTTLCKKLHLPLSSHSMPYQVQWLDGKETFTIEHKVQVPIKIGAYEDTIECDVVPMKVCHMLLGRPWQFDKRAIHDGHSNIYSFKWLDNSYVFCVGNIP